MTGHDRNTNVERARHRALNNAIAAAKRVRLDHKIGINGFLRAPTAAHARRIADIYANAASTFRTLADRIEELDRLVGDLRRSETPS
jgi:hypothetical protein